MPTETELITLARVLYGDTSINKSKYYTLTMKNKAPVYSALGLNNITSGDFGLWSDTSDGSENAYLWRLYSTGTDYKSFPRNDPYRVAVCFE